MQRWRGLRTERENIGTLQYYFSCTICRSMKSLLIVCPRVFCMHDKNWGGNVAGEFRPLFPAVLADLWPRLERYHDVLRCIDTSWMQFTRNLFERFIGLCFTRFSAADVDFSRGRKKYTSILFHVCSLLFSPLLLFTGENFLPRNKFDCRFQATLGLENNCPRLENSRAEEVEKFTRE